MVHAHRSVVALGASLVVLAVAGTSSAQAAPTSMGEVVLNDSGCAACPASFVSPRRYVAFGLASDSPFATSLAGRVDVSCADGSTYDLLLTSPRQAGLFQLIPNSCTNFEAEKVTLNVTSVGLSPPDHGHGVTIQVFGVIR